MSQTDLYSLLSGFSGKVKTPLINITDFLSFVSKYARQKPAEDTEWAKWAFNANTKFWAEIPGLTESGKCVLLAEEKGGQVYLPAAARLLIESAYKDTDHLSGIPFPNDKSLRLTIPEGHIRTLSLIPDMELFFVNNEETPEPDEIISLIFPQNCGSALLLADMIPGKLMEIALLKMRFYLQSRSNKDYVLNKLIGQMQGREKVLRDIIDKIMIRPLDCLSEMVRSADFPYLFWTYFCPLVKNDIHKKNEFLAEDISALQGVSIIEVCSSFYRAQAAKKREIDAAFLTLEVLMDRTPWHYTLDEIVLFTNDRGISLLDIYSQADLEEFIRKAINESAEGSLPKWLVVHGEKNERWFLKKERYLLICIRMLIEAQLPVKNAIIKRWAKLIKNYQKEPSMSSDSDFEKLLERQTKVYNPVLKSMLEDPKLRWTFEELEKAPGAISQASRIFRDGELLPYSSLYSLHRKELLSGIKIKLPFWYSIPFIVAIIAFFRELFGKKPAPEQNNARDSGDDFVIVEQETNELSSSARHLESVIVPRNLSLDEYLLELESRWAQLLDIKARENLVHDVQSWLKDNLANALKVYKLKRITREGLQEMATMLIKRGPTLQKIKDQESLRLYMELYMLKHLMQPRSGKA